MEKNEEWRKGIEKEGDVQNEKEIENEIQERGKKERQMFGRSKSRDRRVGLLNTKAYLDRRLLHLGPREKVCWQRAVNIIHSLEFELPM